MEQDFLDIEQPQRQTEMAFGEAARKLIAFTVITALDIHPNKESLAPMLVVKKPDRDCEMSADMEEFVAVEPVLESARVVINEDPSIEAYAVVVDSVDEFPDFPSQRPTDEEGNPLDENTPVIAVWLGERGKSGSALVIQAYRKRFFRGGAVPVGSPLILEGPPTLFA